MSRLRRLFNFFRSDRHSNDIDRELAFHIAERADALIANGTAPADARAQSRRMFGNVGGQKERTRDADILTWLDAFAGDVRYGIRALRNTPVFTFVAVSSLALGIGANTAIFSLIDAVMLRSLPISHPEELMQVTLGDNGDEFTNPIWEALRDKQNAFSGIFAYSLTRFNLTSGGEAQYVSGSLVSGDYFRTLGVRPQAGRLVSTVDDQRGCSAVAVIGDGFWRSQFGGDPSAVGKTISLNTHPYRVIGVSQQGFGGLEVGRGIDVFVPICSDVILRGTRSKLDGRANWWLQVMGRPRGDLTPTQARSQLGSIAGSVFAATVPPEFGEKQQLAYQKNGFDLTPAGSGVSSLRDRYKLALETLMVIVALVLVIACANVANLLLARAAAREQETAVRVALGAGRGRLVRQFLTESLLLSLGGALVGMMFARWGSRLLVTLLSAAGNQISLDLALDQRVLGFSIGVAVLTGFAFGLAPAWRSSRVPPSAALKASGRGVVAGQRRFNAGQVLVVAQIAISLTLVVGAGLLLGTFQRLSTINPGFKPESVLLVALTQQNTSATAADHFAIDTRALQRLRDLPGVASASMSQLTPIGPLQWNGELVVDGFTPQSRKDASAFNNEVSDGYFKTLGTTMVAGRDFADRDRVGAPTVAIVNEALAAHFFPGKSPIGRTFKFQHGRSDSDPVEIIAIVKDAKYHSMREKPTPTVYLAYSQDTTVGVSTTIELRSTTDPKALIPGVKAALADVSPDLSLTFTPFATQVNASLARERLLAMLSVFFGILALLLAMLGLYGVMSYNVARRRNEIGIHMALGAGVRRVTTMVLRNVGVMVTTGLLLGLALSLATTRLISTFLFGVAPTDIVTFGGSMAVLATVALLAAYVPARRASKVDPMEALREQ
ncbi:MAG: ABC transporter permease [Gemmatimonadaceae bacterium]